MNKDSDQPKPSVGGSVERLVRLELVADIAAQCSMDLSTNLATAHKEYLAGDIARGAYENVLSRHSSLHVALHRAGYTAKHPVFDYPIKPNAELNRDQLTQ